MYSYVKLLFCIKISNRAFSVKSQTNKKGTIKELHMQRKHLWRVHFNIALPSNLGRPVVGRHKLWVSKQQHLLCICTKSVLRHCPDQLNQKLFSDLGLMLIKMWDTLCYQASYLGNTQIREAWRMWYTLKSKWPSLLAY